MGSVPIYHEALITHLGLQSQGFIPIGRAGPGGVMLER